MTLPFLQLLQLYQVPALVTVDTVRLIQRSLGLEVAA